MMLRVGLENNVYWGTYCTYPLDNVWLPRMCSFRVSTQNHFRWPAEKIGLLPSMFFDENEEWTRSRRLICPSLHGRQVAVMIPSIAHVRGQECTRRGEERHQTNTDCGKYPTSSFGVKNTRITVNVPRLCLERNQQGLR